MSTRVRSAAAVLFAASALLLAGCASGSPAPDASENGTSPTGPAETVPAQQAEAVWLDGGRLIGVVTWGSSSCVPQTGEVAASGQKITVSLSDPAADSDGEQRPCTADLAPRATAFGVPEGVDPRQDVEIELSYAGETTSLELDGEDELTGAPGSSTDYAPSAAWFGDDTGIVLLTWGSSTCTPQVDAVEESDTAITVSFTPNEGVCTMDMVPRLTMLSVTGHDDDRVLTLVGDNLDGTVRILG